METGTHGKPFTTRSHEAFKRGMGRRFAGATVVALLALVIAVLLGPDQETIKKKFEHYGAPGELHIMPEVAIDEGSDLTHQLPRSLQAPPPPARIEVLPEKLDPDAGEPVPAPLESPDDSDVPDDPTHNAAEQAEREQVELTLPQQSNPDWYILHLVRPDYPLEVTEEDRRRPVVFVRVAIFVDPDGTVREKMVTATDGGVAYSVAVLDAVGQWRFGWRVEPGSGRWIEMTWNFHSPYFTDRP